VEVVEDEKEIRISVEDDGRGFDPEAPVTDEQRKHWGLMGIRERAEILGGTAKIESAVGKGTRVEVRIPISVMVNE
jgi:signal transduction histidine kinase